MVKAFWNIFPMIYIWAFQLSFVSSIQLWFQTASLLFATCYPIIFILCFYNFHLIHFTSKSQFYYFFHRIFCFQILNYPHFHMLVSLWLNPFCFANNFNLFTYGFTNKCSGKQLFNISSFSNFFVGNRNFIFL